MWFCHLGCGTTSATITSLLHAPHAAFYNVTAWLNGKKVVERSYDYRSLYRADRYRAAVSLPAGETTLLLKLTKTRPDDGQQAAAAKAGRPAWHYFKVKFTGGCPRLNYDLHRASGLYSSALLFVIAVTGATMAFYSFMTPAVYWLTSSSPKKPGRPRW